MPIKKNNTTLYTIADLKPIAENGGIVRGTFGGLILGNYHSEGGIKVIRRFPDENDELYEPIAEFEGWEYILNPLATQKEMEYLTQLNSEFSGSENSFIEYEIPKGITIIDTRPIFKDIKETNRIILLEEWAQFIINKHSTKKYLVELDEINKKYSR